MTEDGGGEQVDFLDKPMKKQAFENSYRIMKEEKEHLIRTKHAIIKIVKSSNKYDVGGKVVGRANTTKKGETGTIAEVCGGDVYLIEWDDENLLPCRMEKKHLVLQKGFGETYRWEVVRDHIAPNPPTKYEKVGIEGFSMKSFDVMPTDDKGEPNPDYDHPFARLLEALWPGDWRQQLERMNAGVRAAGNLGKECTVDEWWTFWGILIFAAKVEKGGVDALFDKGRKKLLNELPSIDLSERMKKYRFEQLKRVIPTAFHGDDEADPWNPITSLINGFNNKRARKIAASFWKLHDESMSPYKPRTSKYGGLPFLSFILRKPKPIGTEFKVTACSETGKCLALAVMCYSR
jgi:hypothetical protein